MTRRILAIAAPAVCLLLFGGADLESRLAPSIRRDRPAKFRDPASDVTAAAWKTDLRSVGFLDPPSKDSTWHPVYSQGPLFFADEHVLIAVFTTREEISTLTRRDDPNRQMPWKVHAVSLDAATGSVRATNEWGLRAASFGMIGRGDGSFVLFTPLALATCLADLHTCKELRFSPEQASRLAAVHFSPTGRSVLLQYQGAPSDFEWLDTGSLQSGPAWQGTEMPLSVSDSAAVFVQTHREPRGMNHTIALRLKDGTQRVVCSATADDRGCFGVPKFVGDDILALREARRLRLVPGSGGKSLMELEAPRDEWLGAPVASADGSRIAFPVSVPKEGKVLVDVPSDSELLRIEVRKIHGGEPICKLDGARHKLKSIAGLALSPNGSIMAILADGIVSLYRLPVP